MELEKTARYDIELLATGPDKRQLEQFLHHVRGLAMSPQEMVEACPCILATNVSSAVSQKLLRYLHQLGAEVAIRKHAPVPLLSDASLVSASPYPSREEVRPNQADVATSATQEESEDMQTQELSPPIISESDDLSSKNGAPYQVPYQVPSPNLQPSNGDSVSPSIKLKRTVGELTTALQDKDWLVREQAIVELGQIPSGGILRHLISMLKDDVWRVRCTAVYMLSLSGSDAVLRELTKCAEDDVWHVRYQAVEALGRMESDKIIKPLLLALHDPNWQVRQRTVQILGGLQSKRALHGVLACLEDEVWYVRASAAMSLAKLKSEKSVKALIEALHDPNWHVRSMVVSALREIGSEETIMALVEALGDENWMVHWKVAYTLGKIGTTAIFQVLSRLNKENAPLLGEAARKVLSELDIVVEPHPHAQPRLEYRSDDPYARMCYIPAGEFVMGSEIGHDDAKPAHQIMVPEFYIDAYEVTNAQYKLFDPAHAFAEGMDWHPVVNVTWEEAQAYAEWVGKRLPSEAEWEKAARGGSKGYLYPWGEIFDPTRCNTEESGNRRLTPVNLYPGGRSPYKVHDMFGNVLEWTADRYRPYPGSQYDSPDFQENFVVLRGCPWIHQGKVSNCATRTYAPADNRSNFIGFRCVKDVE